MDQHNGPYVGPIEREMRRGLLQSPEKGSKPKGKKYIRYASMILRTMLL